MLEGKLRTPCVGICSTSFGGDICRGCKRFAHEIIDWNGYGEIEKTAVHDRLEALLIQVLAPRFKVVDPALLYSQLQAMHILCNPAYEPLCWVMDLIRAAPGRITDFADFGIEVRKLGGETAPSALGAQLDEEFYRLSEAHYQRYFFRRRGL